MLRGPSIGLTTPKHFFWATGALSSVLDNAPTYVVFFATAKTLNATPSVAGRRRGALGQRQPGSRVHGLDDLYRQRSQLHGQGIAEKSGVRMPSFFGYMAYSCLVLLPLFI